MNSNDNFQPLVSIGVPTYNRPKLLRRALHLLTSQTYKNLEIIVSDNASSGKESLNVVAEFMANDSRISFHRQTTNIGAHNNFFFVFGKSTGEFFMWAADDDQWEPWFVERCVETLQQTPKCSAAIAEVQYVGSDAPYPFFAQGSAFYNNKCDATKRDALLHLLENNYDNLIYSIFRRESLLHEGILFFERYGLITSNEIPTLLFVTLTGGFVVLPEIGMYKEVSEGTFRQAMWEVRGGWLPSNGRVRSFNSMCQTWKYHAAALADIENGIALFPIDFTTRRDILKRTKKNLIKHFIWLLLGYKPVRE